MVRPPTRIRWLNVSNVLSGVEIRMSRFEPSNVQIVSNVLSGVEIKALKSFSSSLPLVSNVLSGVEIQPFLKAGPLQPRFLMY